MSGGDMTEKYYQHAELTCDVINALIVGKANKSAK
jgi:hypothetical protein